MERFIRTCNDSPYINIGASTHTVCVLLPGSFLSMEAFYFKAENRRDILNTTLRTRTTAQYSH